MLTLLGVRCIRGGKTLFEDLSITIASGSFIILNGPNGSGKTSLLHIIAGLLPPSSGDVTYDEKENEGIAPLYHYIGHKSGVALHKTIEEMLYFWAGLGVTPELVPAAMHYFKLTPLKHQKCGTLSVGWKQRVALARLLASPSHLWLLDEPFSHLDKEGIEMLCNAIYIHCNEGGIVIMVSHGEEDKTYLSSLIKNAFYIALSDFFPKKEG